MKKRIKKREYNTKTAEKVAEYTSPNEASSLYFYEQELYRKTTGEFFLYGWGNTASPYAKPIRDGMSGGEDITPLTYDEAEKWAEEHLSAEEIDRIFGAVKEDGNVHRTFNLSKSAFEKLKKKAAKDNISMTEVLERLIANEA